MEWDPAWRRLKVFGGRRAGRVHVLSVLELSAVLAALASFLLLSMGGVFAEIL